MAFEPRTREDLVRRSLAILGVVGAGQRASAEDFTLMDSLVDTMLGDLEARDVVFVGDPGAIDIAIFEDLARRLAAAAAADFDMPDRAQLGAEAEASLRLKGSGNPTYQHQKTSYF